MLELCFMRVVDANRGCDRIGALDGVLLKSTAVRGYAETVHPGSTLTAWVYGPTGTTVHPMTRPPADDLERPTEPM